MTENVALISMEGSSMLEAQQAGTMEKFHCYQCLCEIEPKKARAHVGQHILKSMRGIAENLASEPVSNTLGYVSSLIFLQNVSPGWPDALWILWLFRDSIMWRGIFDQRKPSPSTDELSSCTQVPLSAKPDLDKFDTIN